MKQTFELYNGDVVMEFDPDAARNRYIVDGTPVRGVTTVLSDILHKQGLIMWPLNEAVKHLFGYKWDDTLKKGTYNAANAILQPGGRAIASAISFHVRAGSVLGTVLAISACARAKRAAAPPNCSINTNTTHSMSSRCPGITSNSKKRRL